MRPWAAFASFAICAVILAAQIVIPPYIGLADNGDFAKIAGPRSLGPKEAGSNFIFFVADYVHAARSHWASPIHSTETPFVWLATFLANANREGAPFNIRWLGAIHAIVFLFALQMFLSCVETLSFWRAAFLSAIVIVIFTDVVYVAYFNSFYTDTVALLGLLLAAASAVHIALDNTRLESIVLFFLASLLFIGSKPQHAVWGFVFAAFLLLVSSGRGIAAALTLVAASVVTVRLTPPDYSFHPLFTVVFTQIAPSDSQPETVLRELGLRKEDAVYAGMHADMPDVPAPDSAWGRDFIRTIDYGVIAKWYVSHPFRTLSILDQNLKDPAAGMRPWNLSNFQRQDGHPFGARTNRFAFWSDLRSALLTKWPHHMIVWYLFVIAGSLHYVRNPSPVRRQLGWIALGIAVLGLGEFAVATLADAAETWRHLFLFHACTDLTICFAAAAALTADAS